MKENKQPEQSTKTNQRGYTSVDSIIMFFAVLVLPTIIALPFYSFFDEATKNVMAYIIPQVSIILSFIVLSLVRKVNIKKANQINFKLNWWIVLLMVALGVITILGFSPLVSMFDAVVAKLGYNGSDVDVTFSSIWSLFAKLVYIGLLPAICEELAVRGVITNGFKKFGLVLACVFSGIFFMVMHMNIQQAIYQLFMGVLMAYIVLKTGSIIYTMILHFFNNAFILVSTYINQVNGVPETVVDLSNAWNIVLPILYAVLAVGVVVGLMFLMNYILKKQKAKQSALAANNQENQQNNGESEQNLTKNAKNDFETEETKHQNDTHEMAFAIIAVVAAIAIWIAAIVQGFLGK